MVTAHLDFLGQTFENADSSMEHLRWFAMHRIRQHAQFPSEALHNSLEPETHAKYGYSLAGRVSHQLRHAEVLGAPRSGRDQNHVRVHGIQDLEGSSGAIGNYFRSRLSRI